MNKEINVVIVDDNIHTLNDIKENLMLEFDEIEIETYDKILKIERSVLLKADFLLMDYNLDESMNGIQLAQKLIESGYTGIIIFITGEGGFVFNTKLKLSGLKDYFNVSKDDKFIDTIIEIIEENK